MLSSPFRYLGVQCYVLHIGSDCPPGDVGLGYFLGFKILNFNIFGGFQKTEYF